jgi:hypothetical protein
LKNPSFRGGPLNAVPSSRAFCLESAKTARQRGVSPQSRVPGTPRAILLMRRLIMAASLLALGASPLATPQAIAQPTPAGQTTTAPTTEPAEERFMSDEEFPKIGQDFDLDAIIKSLEPIPTREQILDDLIHTECRPNPPTLSEAMAKKIDERETQIETLKQASATGDDARRRRRCWTKRSGWPSRS